MLKVKFLNWGNKPDEDGYCFMYDEDDVRNKTWLEVLMLKFHSIIATLIYDYNWYWLSWFISFLATTEMEIRLLFNKELQEELDCCNVGIGYDDNGELKTKASENIPKKTFYCQGCPYGVYDSNIAEFFYGYQSGGYCYYIGKGDFSFVNPTDLLWDGCKCCGINEDIDIDDEE